MSSFTKQVGNDKWFCLDDYFGKHEYGYVKMTEEEKKSDSPWDILDYKTLEGRGGSRKVLRTIKL